MTTPGPAAEAARATFRAHLGASGHAVENARIASGSLLLGQPILDRIPQWKFKATRADGKRSSEAIALYFEFRLGEPAAGPPKSLFVYDYPNRFTITANTLLRTH